jgi:hypothetical protein
MNTDTPLPPDEPTGKNPPDGAIIDYYLHEKPKGAITLDIEDITGKTIRHYSSNDTMYKIPDVNIPLYWIRPQQILSADTGSHRFLWDMRLTPLNIPAGYAIGAIFEDTPPVPTAPWAMPGSYTIRLTVNGKVYSQSLALVMDPRVKTPYKILTQQYDLSFQCYKDEDSLLHAAKELDSLVHALQSLKSKSAAKKKKMINEMVLRASKLKSGEPENFSTLFNKLQHIFNNLQGTDTAPTTQCISALNEYQSKFDDLWQRWEGFKKEVIKVKDY